MAPKSNRAGISLTAYVYSCGIQAMAHPASLLDIRLLNAHADLDNRDRTLEAQRPEWYRFGQQRSWLPVMERVCGTQNDVDIMKHSHSFSAAGNAVLKRSWSVIGGSVLAATLALVMVAI